MSNESDLEHYAPSENPLLSRFVVFTWIAALLVITGVLLNSSLRKSDLDTEVATRLFEQAKIKTTTIETQFSDSELTDIPQFSRANQSLNRAQMLLTSENVEAAIPHVQSALALLDTTVESVYRHRFNVLKAVVIEQQLAALDLPVESSLTIEADNALHKAMKSYQENELIDALERLSNANAVLQELLSTSTVRSQ